MPASLDSVTVVAADFARSLAFYDAALGALGMDRSAEYGDEEEDEALVEAVGWAAGTGPVVLWLVGGPAATVGAHVTLQVEDRHLVEAFFSAATAAGGTPQRAPRRWVVYRRGTVSAAVADPAGNTLEIVAPE